MNVQCVAHNNKVIVRADSGVRIMPNYDNILDILKYENVLELLRYYNQRDNERFDELGELKSSIDGVGTLFNVGCLTAAGVSFVLGTTDVIPDAYAITLGSGTVAAAATYSVLGKFVGSKHYERMGLMECLNFQEDKIRRLENKIAKCYKKGKVVETPETMFYVDDRIEKDRLNKVLNFIFYMGCHRTKVRNIVKKLQLHSFLSEKFNISDVDSLIEIENYVYREFSDEFEKASGYRIK